MFENGASATDIFFFRARQSRWPLPSRLYPFAVQEAGAVQNAHLIHARTSSSRVGTTAVSVCPLDRVDQLCLYKDVLKIAKISLPQSRYQEKDGEGSPAQLAGIVRVTKDETVF
ncbi:hypothetical protein HI914_07159 [Erysiphe necator]|nr:hypothetical protein HI914_07159 [Erysiphe necator]